MCSSDLNPAKVKEMRARFVAEAKKYQVFPLDASVAARIVEIGRASCRERVSSVV